MRWECDLHGNKDVVIFGTNGGRDVDVQFRSGDWSLTDKIAHVSLVPEVETEGIGFGIGGIWFVEVVDDFDFGLGAGCDAGGNFDGGEGGDEGCEPQDESEVWDRGTHDAGVI